MDIVHFCPRPSFSGLEHYAWLLAFEQLRQGHNVKFVALKNSPLEQKCQESNIPLLQLNLKTQWGTGFFAPTKELKILHLHSTLDVRSMSPYLTLKKLGVGPKVKVILQTHIWLDHKKKDLWHQLMYWGIDEIWCSSSMAKENLQNLLPVKPNQIKVVPYGRDIPQIDKNILPKPVARQKLSLPQDKIVIGSVNRIDPGKGTWECVEGLIPILKHYPEVVFVWIGPPTAQDTRAQNYYQNLMGFIQNLEPEIRKRIYFLGAIDESYKYLKAFDGYILPTHKECFSLSLMEAQIAGIPCMATNSGGSPEIVREGQTGWLFEPQSAEAITKVVKRFLNEKENWIPFTQAARKRMEKDFNFPVVFKTLMEMYRQ